ncbi:MAG TPA: translation elongation factor Ts [Phycisphaerae bacterium]|nr:translation elongation factor Ts [Phycisphaerae bacterium]
MGISAAEVKTLRERTGQGMMECKRALEEACGDADKAVEILRKKGMATAEKKAGRAAAQGRIHSYIHHNGRVGVLLEVNCETDFVAKNAEFQGFLNDLCLHICAAAPLAVRREEIPEDLVETERRIAREQVEGSKPDNIVEKIVEGKLKKWYAEWVLLEQPYVKDDKRSVQEMLTEQIAKIGENLVIKRFVRFEVGESKSD